MSGVKHVARGEKSERHAHATSYTGSDELWDTGITSNNPAFVRCGKKATRETVSTVSKGKMMRLSRGVFYSEQNVDPGVTLSRPFVLVCALVRWGGVCSNDSSQKSIYNNSVYPVFYSDSVSTI